MVPDLRASPIYEFADPGRLLLVRLAVCLYPVVKIFYSSLFMRRVPVAGRNR